MDETLNPIDPGKLYSKISWRLIPYIFILYILAYLDRVNVGFAAPEFKHDLHLSDTIYGLGGGIFFAGQMLFDLPSNLILGKVGPRIWIARIMITWGVIATCMMFVEGARSFIALRFLLGISEAGFFPGMILYLTYWFPSGERARAIARFMTATSIAGVVGAPLSSFLLKLEGKSGLHGWQWLFMMEGLPTILGGISVLFILKDRPDDAAWLSLAEKKWLDAELDRDRKEGGAADKHKLADAFRMPMVWVLAGIFLLSQVGVYTVNLWMPLLLHEVMPAFSTSLIARYATLPYVAAAICTVLVGWNSDRTKERRWHIAGCFLLRRAWFRLGRSGTQPGHDAVRHDARRDRLLEHDGSVLGVAHARSRRTRSARRSRDHHDDRQHRRLHRPLPDRRVEGPDPQLHRRTTRDRRPRRLRRRPLHNAQPRLTQIRLKPCS